MARSEVERTIKEYAPRVINSRVFHRLVDQDPRFLTGEYLTEEGFNGLRRRLFIINHHSIREARLNAACQSDPSKVKKVLFEKAVVEELISRGTSHFLLEQIRE